MNKENRELGMLLGLHVGDSLGATLEFSKPSLEWNSHKDIIGEGPFRWNPGDATDDTDLMLCVLKSLNGRMGLNTEQLKNRMINWRMLEPKDIGKATQEGIECLENNLPLTGNGRTTLSNGSLMRCAPLALIDLEGQALRDIIRAQANMTHGAEEVLLTDELYILTLKKIIAGATKKEVKDFALEWTKDNFIKFHHSLMKVSTTPWSHIPSSGYILDGLFCAFWALENHTNFKDSVVSIVNRGDDSDTCGAITGAVCGAFYGKDQIPKEWRDVIQYGFDIEMNYKVITK